MKILITGAAGFIGSNLMRQLAEKGETIIGIDELNDYYDVRLKFARLKECGISKHGNPYVYNEKVQSSIFENCLFVKMSIDDKESVDKLFKQEKFDKVVNLAAQAGVRYSITNPYSYLNSNIVGFLNILEACRNYGVAHLVFASSSSVYGLNSKMPYSEEDKVDSPVSLYAASKKSNELMAHAYSKLYNFAVSGLRYFTVYGPWGRPDMAPMLFAKSISNDEPIKIFNNGNLSRDFTYIDDIVEGTMRVLYSIPKAGECENGVPYKIYNIGCSHPVKLMDFISEMESALGKEAVKEYLPMQQGDVSRTYADTSRLEKELGYKPKISLHEGIAKFIEWYKSDSNPLKG